MSVEGRLVELLRPVVEGLGYELWGVEFVTQQGRNVLRVFIEHDHGIGLDDCSRVSHQLSGVLDVEDPIRVPYDLEVSSPGLDRPLFTEDHYVRSLGSLVKIRVRHAVQGRRNFSGRIVSVGAGEVVIGLSDERYPLSIQEIETARLVPET